MLPTSSPIFESAYFSKTAHAKVEELKQIIPDLVYAFYISWAHYSFHDHNPASFEVVLQVGYTHLHYQNYW